MEEVVEDRCPACQAVLPPYRGQGRPRRFCGPYCRRVQEYRLRRVERRLATADSDVEEYDRRARGLGFGGENVEHAKQRLVVALERRAEIQAELNALIGRSEGRPA